MHQITIGILGSIGITLIYFYIVNVPAIYMRLTRKKLGKPFNCSFCMCFWTSMIYFICNTQLDEAIFLGSATPFIYMIVEEHITNKFEL
jgi:hypothetical protein